LPSAAGAEAVSYVDVEGEIVVEDYGEAGAVADSDVDVDVDVDVVVEVEAWGSRCLRRCLQLSRSRRQGGGEAEALGLAKPWSPAGS